MEKIKRRNSFRKIMIWAGIILTGLLGIVLFGGDKVTSGILLIATMVIMMLPIRQNKTLKWVRVVFVFIVFVLVIWNISTSEIPGDAGMNMIGKDGIAEENEIISTGFRFLDQLIYIFKGFLEGRVFHYEPY